MNDSVEDVLRAAGAPFRRRGNELVSTCPACEKPEHMYISAEAGLWQCKRCGEKGNLYQLRERLGLGNRRSRRDLSVQSMREGLKVPPKRIPMDRVEALHRALLSDADALAYCTETRRWSLDVVKRFKIGMRVDNRGKWLAFPWLRGRECCGMKFRILPAYQENYPPRFDREAGCESILFNVDALAQYDDVILASGESDALSLLTLGFENVIATTTGEGALPPGTSVDALAKKARVFLPFDNDAAGQKGAREIGKRIGLDRTWLVTLPADAKDANEFLVRGGTREQFGALLDAAVQFDIPSVFSVAQALDRLEEERASTMWDVAEMTPWPTVNDRIGMWRGGNLVVLSGPQGTGKTTWSLNVAASWARNGDPALVYCLEMNVAELVQHVLCSHYQVTEEQVTAELIARARVDLADWPLYLGANPRLTGRKEVLDLLGQAVRRYGLRLVVFDNLHILARSIEHRTEEVGSITKGFKLFAMDAEIPVLLIAQPRKLNPGQVMTPWDLKDSVDIYSDSDQIILLHRELLASTNDTDAVAAAATGAADTNMSPLTLVRIAKARHRPSRDAVLYFEGSQHRFRELMPGETPPRR